MTQIRRSNPFSFETDEWARMRNEKENFFPPPTKNEKKIHRNFKNALSGGFCWEGKKCQLFFIIVQLNPMELTW